MDYSILTEIIVKSQKELDDIPVDFKGQIYVEFGTCSKRAVINKRYERAVVARDNSVVEARGNSTVEARGNSAVEACGNSFVEARDNSVVEARGNSTVEAWGNSTVEAWDNSAVVAWDNSTVEANGNVQVVDYLQNAKIKIAGNARIVYNPKNIVEFMDFYGIKHTKTTATFYKAVHKTKDGTYRSDYRQDFSYEIGAVKMDTNIDTDTRKDCGQGIHISHLGYAVDFGKGWDDLAIIEVKTKINDIVLPRATNGKVRTSEVKVIREVPLEECGLMGKILAKRRSKNETV